MAIDYRRMCMRAKSPSIRLVFIPSLTVMKIRLPFYCLVLSIPYATAGCPVLPDDEDEFELTYSPLKQPDPDDEGPVKAEPDSLLSLEDDDSSELKSNVPAPDHGN
ncbi:hypothetical protein FOZ63_023611 [Perkinsus olseni]|uniref:Uncharacterized protein n=1 Tax=Perkinsus olseni TaxID=32597 RepID=A0A7J6Q261_PEROL|nr:hypothetical protein FOZ63_023611 [Perkinsus olseni]